MRNLCTLFLEPHKILYIRRGWVKSMRLCPYSAPAWKLCRTGRSIFCSDKNGLATFFHTYIHHLQSFCCFHVLNPGSRSNSQENC
jgi:hypothetical protein